MIGRFVWKQSLVIELSFINLNKIPSERAEIINTSKYIRKKKYVTIILKKI